MYIVADHRERQSGVIELLKQDGVDVTITHLPWGDYIINKEICIERKTGRDFLISIMDGRLFRQAKMLKIKFPRPIFLIEGNPFQTDLNFSPKSIKGAILSLQSIWYIPVVFSHSKENTCELIEMIAEQEMKQSALVTIRHGYRQKKMTTKQLYILQGLPNVGSLLAKRMLEHFGTVRRIFSANEDELREIDGIGLRKARRICQILDHVQDEQVPQKR